MDTLLRALHTLVPVAWTAATAAYFHVFLRDESRATRWARWFVVLAVFLELAEFGLAGSLAKTSFATGAPVASGMAVAAAMVYLFLEKQTGRGSMGVFAIGACTGMAILGSATAGGPPPETTQKLPAVTTTLHIGGAIMGYSGLLLAALFGTLYALQFRALRARRFGLFWERLPSLELLDQFTSASLGVATIFLTATIGLGHAVKATASPEIAYWDQKVIATNLLWLLTLLVTVGRRTRRLRAHPASIFAIVLFGLALVNLLVVNYFSPMHSKV